MIKRLRIVVAAIAALALVAPPSAAFAADGWPWPVTGDVITAFKNGSDPYAAGQHRGIDIAAPVGAAVRSSIGGTVTYAGHLPDGGITATVRSGDGQYLVSYLHLSALAVARGDSVSAGSEIGSVGTTGKRSADQPHLHLSVRLATNGAYVDPLPLLGPPAVAKAPAAEAPATAKPVENAAPQANAKTDARAKTQARADQPKSREHRATAHLDSRAAKPLSVHAPATGDSVSATHTDRAADSARESHASTGNGRVAPPPLPAVAPKSTNLATPDRAPAQLDSMSHAATSNDKSGPPYVPALLFLIVASCVALAIRRRARASGGFSTPPLAHREDLVPDGEDSAEVVEFRAAHRRA